jgi:hypothetical protein
MHYGHASMLLFVTSFLSISSLMHVSCLQLLYSLSRTSWSTVQPPLAHSSLSTLHIVSRWFVASVDLVERLFAVGLW